MPNSGPPNNPEEVTTWAVMYLVRLGYVVEMPGSWETREQFCRRIGISKRTFNRRIRSRWLPQADIKRGPTGRLICLRSNSVFDQFMRRRWGPSAPVRPPISDL